MSFFFLQVSSLLLSIVLGTSIIFFFLFFPHHLLFHFLSFAHHPGCFLSPICFFWLRWTNLQNLTYIKEQPLCVCICVCVYVCLCVCVGGCVQHGRWWLVALSVPSTLLMNTSCVIKWLFFISYPLWSWVLQQKPNTHPHTTHTLPWTHSHYVHHPAGQMWLVKLWLSYSNLLAFSLFIMFMVSFSSSCTAAALLEGKVKISFTLIWVHSKTQDFLSFFSLK